MICFNYKQKQTSEHHIHMSDLPYDANPAQRFSWVGVALGFSARLVACTLLLMDCEILENSDPNRLMPNTGSIFQDSQFCLHQSHLLEGFIAEVRS